MNYETESKFFDDLKYQENFRYVGQTLNMLELYLRMGQFYNLMKRIEQTNKK